MFAIESIQTKVNFHMNALEKHVKNGNIFLNQSNRIFDSILVDSFIENHYHFMVHHLLALKIQLERFGSSTEEMEGTPLVGDFADEGLYRKERKRPEEHKNRVKALRSSKAASLKYVLQWENLMDDQKNQNVFNNVPMRRISRKIRLDEIPEVDDLKEDVSKVMVTKRVELFERYKKPKRVSSTMEAFLENSYDKTKICSILENLKEEDEDVRSSKRLSEGLINYEEIFGQNSVKTTDKLENVPKECLAKEKLDEEDVKSKEIKLSESLLNYGVVLDDTLPKTTDQVEGIQKVSSMTENLKDNEKETVDKFENVQKECLAKEKLDEEDVKSTEIKLSEGLLNYPVVLDKTLSKTTDQVKVSSVTENLEDNEENIKNSKTEEVTPLQTKDFLLTSNEISKYPIQNFSENDSQTIQVNPIEIENFKSNETFKPRIVQVHYKQNISKSLLP